LDTRDAARHVTTALVEAARWVGSDGIVVERVTPEERASELRTMVAAAQV
jgi:hypothetical protein